jgi:YHS domain-containing protein
MHSRTKAPLLLVAAAIAVSGGLLLHILGNAASVSRITTSSSTGTNTSGLVTGGTHSDVQPHSANVLSAGDYHIEAQLSPKGHLEIYVYGQKERQLFPLETTGLDLAMEAKAIVPGEDSVEIPMKPKPYSTDPEGTASRFVGSFSRRPDHQEVGLSLTLPINGKTYRVQWRPENLKPGQSPIAEPGMPQAVTSDQAKRLFLTPGGIYNDADMDANGRMTAQQKYGNQMSMHNAHPRPGDRLCPITDTVANPKFAWVVGGKTYLFCCPPCIEEFVKRAKEQPDTIKAPEKYVKP